MKFLLTVMSLSLALFAFADDSRLNTMQEMLRKYDDCQVLVHAHQPSDVKGTHLGFCIYEWVETRGIYADRACVVSIIEPETQTRDPYYGKDGHWGTMGSCSKQKIQRLLRKKDTYTTVNPITAMQERFVQGWRIKLLKDELSLWPELGPILQKPTPVFETKP